MITDQVIQEIYKKFRKPPKSVDDLNLPHYMSMLNEHHKLTMDDEEVIIRDLEEGNLFSRFLIRSLYTVLEFDKMIAFVFRSHILFFGKEDNTLRVHMKREEVKPSLWNRIFGR